MAADSLIGTVIDRRYTVVRRIGVGGMGIVYLAEHVTLPRRVALKVLRPEYAHDEEFRTRFLRESQLAASLDHPAVIRVHDVAEDEGLIYIAMDYVDGVDLRALLERRGRLSPELTVRLLTPVASALDAAHAAHLIHRDIKPGNVLVTTDGRVFVTDFGLAKTRLGASTGLSRADVFMGTAKYAAPEQWRGARDVDHRADVYALACVLYECLSGRSPFEVDSTEALMRAHLDDSPEPLSRHREGMPAELDDVLARGLAKDPDDRPQSAGELLAEATRVLACVPGLLDAPDATHLPPPRPVPLPEEAPAAEQPPAPPPPPPAPAPAPAPAPETVAEPAARVTAPPVRRDPQRGRRPPGGGRPRSAPPRALIAGGAVVVLLAAGGGLALALRGGDEPAAAPPAVSTPSTTTGTGATTGAQLAADTPVAARDRAALAVNGSDLYVTDPGGRVVSLKRQTLAPRHVRVHPDGPSALALSRGELVVAGRSALVRLDAASLAPRGAGAAAALRMTDNARGEVAVLGPRGAAGSRICLLDAGRLERCAAVAFAAGGVGISGDGKHVYAVHTETGRLLPFRVRADGLAAEKAIEVGGSPRGEPVSFGGKLYVLVERGVSVVDIARGVATVVKLPTTPSDLWIVPFSGRAFATLPAVDQVAVFDARDILQAPVLVDVGATPYAVTGTRTRGTGRPVVYVLNVGDRSLSLLDAETGTLVRTRAVPALVRPAQKPLVASSLSFRRTDRTVAARLAFAGGTLHAADLVTIDGSIADGRASFEIWQGAISTRVKLRSYELGGLSVRVTPRPGRLEIALEAARGAFTTLRLARGGRLLTLSFTQPPVTPSTGGGETPAPVTPTAPQPSPPPPPPSGCDDPPCIE